MSTEKEHVFYLSAHRELWDRIVKRIPNDFVTDPIYRPELDDVKDAEINGMAQDGTLQKITGREWETPVDVTCNCFACQYDVELDPEEIESCKHCPLSWHPLEECEKNTGLYNLLAYAYIFGQDIRYAVSLAESIRDCPVKEGVKTI